MNIKVLSILIALILPTLYGFSSGYYKSMERIGIHKRDIMMDRVKEARDTQNEIKQLLVSAMVQFKSMVNSEHGDLEDEYDRLNSTLRKSEAKAKKVRNSNIAVEDVSEALFDEWRAEIKHYNSDALRRSSQQKYDLTRAKYDLLIKAMKGVETKLEPALILLNDQVLFMKHNLNAKTIASLSSEVDGVQINVDKLIIEMETAITEADSFIKTLQSD